MSGIVTEGREVAAAVIERIAQAAEIIAWQAGVGGMETAGSIVSYLALHPEHLDALMAGQLSILDWPVGWHEHGRLTWHGRDGKIYNPETVRQKRIIKQLEKAANTPSGLDGEGMKDV